MDDQSADLTTATATADAPASAADGSTPASSALTDDHHDWVSAFTGIDTRAASSGGSAAASASSDDTSGGGFFSGIANAVSDAASGVISTAENVASDVGHTVSDAASGVVDTVETVAGDVEHTVSDAASGVVDTAGKVASDIGSGNFGDALGDAASGVVSTTGHVVSDVAHTAVDAGSGILSTAGKIVTDTEQAITDAATGAISTAGKVVGDTAQAVAQAAGPNSMLGQAAGAVGNFSTSAASGLVDTVNTVNDFNKGVVEGVVGGVEGLAKGVVSLGDSVGKEAFALATDEKARERAGQTVLHGVEAVGNFEATALTDPSKALGEVEDAAGGAVSTVENMASNVYKDYQAAAAQGHGAEFIGKGVGHAGVLVAGAVLTDGASLAGEGAAVAGEGAALLGEGAALAGEGAAVAGEGAAIAGEGAAIAGEGAAVVGEGTAVVGEGAGAVGEGAAAGEGADAAGEALGNSGRVTPEGDGALRGASGDAAPPSEPPPSEPPPPNRQAAVANRLMNLQACRRISSVRRISWKSSASVSNNTAASKWRWRTSPPHPTWTNQTGCKSLTAVTIRPGSAKARMSVWPGADGRTHSPPPTTAAPGRAATQETVGGLPTIRASTGSRKARPFHSRKVPPISPNTRRKPKRDTLARSKSTG